MGPGRGGLVRRLQRLKTGIIQKQNDKAVMGACSPGVETMRKIWARLIWGEVRPKPEVGVEGAVHWMLVWVDRLVAHFWLGAEIQMDHGGRDEGRRCRQ